MQFAGAVADLVENMTSSCSGQPQATEQVPTALATFQMNWPTNLEDELWQFAGIESLYAYLRKNKSLKIPPEWKAFVPVSLS